MDNPADLGKRVLTMGAFDMFHAGHSALLDTCRDIAGVNGQVSVGVNSDEFIKSYKRDPIISFKDRSNVVWSHRAVDYIFPVEQHDASAIIKAIKPHFIVIGSDWATKDYFTQIGMSVAELYEAGVVVLYKQIDHEITTTQIIEKVRNA